MVLEVSFMSRRALGTFITVIAILIVTPDSILLRELAHIPTFVVMFYRYFMYGGFFFMLVVVDSLRKDTEPWYHRFYQLGWVGWSAGLVWASFNLFITYGLQTTDAGTVLVINASNPMFSALFGYLIIGEIAPWYTIVASVISFFAIFGVFFSSLSAAKASDIVGMFSGLIAAMSVGMFLVLLSYAEKKQLHFDYNLCIVISSVVICIVSIAVEPAQIVPSSMDWFLLFANGVLVLGLSNMLLNIGPTLISAPEVSLIFLLETLLGPVWVYLGGYEAPPSTSVYGGAVLIVTLIAHSVVAMQYDSSVPDIVPALIAQKEQKTNLPSSKKMMKNHIVDDDAAMLI
jgi:drug/metabolite transporter (DMT)-like permease